jgi:alpha-glucosidase (family GH31 glycosyl hydrolase)
MKIKDFLDSPSKWTQEALARDDKGRACDPLSHSAVCFCLLGLMGVFYDFRSSNGEEAWNKLNSVFKGKIIGKWNDAPERTFEEVKALVTELDI